MCLEQATTVTPSVHHLARARYSCIIDRATTTTTTGSDTTGVLIIAPSHRQLLPRVSLVHRSHAAAATATVDENHSSGRSCAVVAHSTAFTAK